MRISYQHHSQWYGLIYYDAWPKIQAGLLESILDDYQLDNIKVYGVFPPGSASSKKLRLLIDFLKDYFVKNDRQGMPNKLLLNKG
jgi:LysR family transcriptional regulator, transcriptional activator for aaeXAB operon